MNMSIVKWTKVEAFATCFVAACGWASLLMAPRSERWRNLGGCHPEPCVDGRRLPSYGSGYRPGKSLGIQTHGPAVTCLRPVWYRVIYG